MSKETNNKTKLYFTVGFTAIIILTSWILNLKRSFSNNHDQEPPDQDWRQISQNFNNLFINVQQLKDKIIDFTQSATSTGSNLQGGPQITFEQLDEMVDRLNVAGSATSSHATSTKME